MNTAQEYQQERLTQDQVNELQRLNQALAQANVELAAILAQKIEYHQNEIDKAEAELKRLDLRLFAGTIHLFTLIFKSGEMALVEVCGAPTQYQARTIMSHLFKHCDYTTLDGNQTNGRAIGDFRCWYSSAAQESQTRQVEEGTL